MSSTLEANDEETGRSSISIGADEKVTVLDFLDEYWFLQNILCQVRMDRTRPPPLDMISSPSKAKESIDHPSPPLSCALVRTPSLPSRVEEKMASRDGEVAASKLSKSKLRHCYSSLNEYQSYSYSKSTTPRPGSTRSSRPPRDMKAANGSMRQRANSDLTISRMSCYKKAFDFQEKKSKSLTDLECFEVQGFRDLGFVFDKGGLNATLVKVIPGLRDQRPAGDVDDDKQVSRPYLSEAWLSQRSWPLTVRWGGRRSAEDMKEQIRFWARSVACNVRQDC